MNVIWTEDAVLTPPTVDVAVAVASEKGLVTPVLRDVAVAVALRAVREDQGLGQPGRRGQARAATTSRAAR